MIKMVKYILACDAGGVRGRSTIQFLLNLENFLIETENKTIYEKFDMFAGSSVGGIISILLALNYDTEKIDKIFSTKNISEMMNKSFLDEIFDITQLKPKYDGKNKTKLIKSICDPCIKLHDIQDKKILITAYDIKNSKIENFINSDYYEKNPCLIEIADATSAAPAYFPPIKIDDGILVDGGIYSVNTSLIAYVNAVKLWGNEEIKVLSIGTGTYNKKFCEKVGHWGGIEWALNGITDVIFDANELLNDYLCDCIIRNYCRINSNLDKNIDLDETDKKTINKLNEIGDQWWIDNDERIANFLTPPINKK